MDINAKIHFLLNRMPELSIKSIDKISRSWDHDVIIINQSYVFRFPKKEHGLQRLLTESMLLSKLHENNLSIHVPHYELFYKEKRLVCSMHKKIDGEPLEKLEHLNSAEAAVQLGAFLTTLHNLNSEKLMQHGLKTIHTQRYWEEFYAEITSKISPFLRSSEQKEVKIIFDRFLSNGQKHMHPIVPIHGDLTGANILYHPARKNISGIIDFTDAQISDPAFDFAGLYWEHGPQFTREVLEHYHVSLPKEELFQRVSAFYGLQPVFHEWLHAANEKSDPNFEKGLDKLLRLQFLQ
ncbi:phosphotransferase family protein [Cytobacillus gottheilii]|uniref:phosphotransferase family protein n=1 Tax=Cytobacillus gottheilii TaxID=859144 RepID=UPI00082BC69F|nr:phosphotransferase [Cytobacillus gottheilii]